MDENIINISPDELPVHPGRIILEVMQEKKVTLETLSRETGFTKRHILSLIEGKKGITNEFARKLEHVLDIPRSFWINLQLNYEQAKHILNNK